jgi:hypothetical protein
MNRRGFIRVGSVVIFFPMVEGVVACGVSPSPKKTNERTSLTFTSTNVSGHTHTTTLDLSTIETPPSGGADRETSSSDGHTHHVVLTQADLTSINSGGTVTKETTLVSSHTHSFSFKKS